MRAKKYRFPIRISELDRFRLGKKRYREIAISMHGGSLNCLDVGCGHNPFPYANVLCDLHTKPVPDRRMRKLVTHGKPFIQCDSHFLPFKDEAFDFVTCYYLIEHLNRPKDVLKELRRVSRHGYVQSPSWLNEIIYGEKVHKWVFIQRNGMLCGKSISYGNRFIIKLGFISNRLYQFPIWRVLHAIIDEKYHLFTVYYTF